MNTTLEPGDKVFVLTGHWTEGYGTWTGRTRVVDGDTRWEVELLTIDHAPKQIFVSASDVKKRY